MSSYSKAITEADSGEARRAAVFSTRPGPRRSVPGGTILRGAARGQRPDGQTILVVNDQTDVAELMSLQLRKAGYRVLTASDGCMGYEVAQAELPNLIISDVVMPRAGGIELCRLVRAHPRLRTTPVLLVSALRYDSESVVEGLKAGADDYLEAPYDRLLLLSKAAQLAERSRTAEALRQSEERYRLLFESNPQPMWVYDLETLRFLAVNEAAVRRYGYSRDEFLAMTIRDIRPPEDVPALLDSVARGLLGLEEAGTWRHRKKDGSVIDVEITSHELEFAGRRAKLVLANDVTGRKRAEQELRRSEERYRELVENAHDIIYTQDLEGNYTSINSAAERVTGYTREEALGMNVGHVAAPEYLEKARRMIARKLAGEKITAYEIEIIAKDGRRVRVEINSSLIVQDGAAVGIQGIARDVTERKELEEQLRQAQKMEAVGKLAGGIAHDFNNLLTVINGYSELAIKRLPAEDPIRLQLEEVRKAGERAAGLTRQLLAFSRKQVLQPKVVDLNEVVRETEKMLRRLIGEDIELRAALEPGLGSVKADPGQMEQVLMNLAVNARDAMPRGGKLTIGTGNVYLDEEYAAHHVSVTPGRYVVLSVSDTGSGMDEGTRRRVFEPFFTTKEQGKGTGLGLSTVYGIVKQSGGYIWVYSEVGHGTSFRIYLPRVDAGPEEHRQESESADALGGTETILLAEDDELVRTMTGIILSDYGYRVLAAANGAAALSLLEQAEGAVHLLLTDVVMPGMSGRELAGRLAGLSPETKVLFMSGYTDDAIVHHGMLDEGVNFIQKPFTPDALARKVREVLGGDA